MGYCSMMENDIVFKSRYSFEELQNKIKSSPIDGYYRVVRGEDYFMMSPYDNEYYCKHYNDVNLVQFVSSVMLPNTTTKVEFTGEDGCKWGYVIFHTNVFDISLDNWQIFDIEYRATVEDKGIDNFIKDYLENLKPNKI